MIKMAHVGDSSALSRAPLSCETPQTKLRPPSEKIRPSVGFLLYFKYSISHQQYTGSPKHEEVCSTVLSKTWGGLGLLWSQTLRQPALLAKSQVASTLDHCHQHLLSTGSGSQPQCLQLPLLQSLGSQEAQIGVITHRSQA